MTVTTAGRLRIEAEILENVTAAADAAFRKVVVLLIEEGHPDLAECAYATYFDGCRVVPGDAQRFATGMHG